MTAEKVNKQLLESLGLTDSQAGRILGLIGLKEGKTQQEVCSSRAYIFTILIKWRACCTPLGESICLR